MEDWERGIGNVPFVYQNKNSFATVHGPGLDGQNASRWYEPLCVQKINIICFQ